MPRKHSASRTASTRMRMAAILVLTVGMVFAGAAPPPATRRRPPDVAHSTWQSRETALGNVPAKADTVGEPVADEQGRHWGVVAWVTSGMSLWLDGKYGPVFQEFVRANITDAGLVYEYEFSSDGSKLAYVIRQDGKMRVVVNHKPEQAEERVTRPTFSPDGLHLAYEVKRQDKYYILLDGVPGPASDGPCGRICFSPDSRRIAYIIRRGSKTCLVLDQQEQPDWPGASNPVFSPDSKRVAYTSLKGFAVLDGKKGPEFPANICWGPVFSADSAHFAYTIGNPGVEGVRQERAFVDWKALPLPNDGHGVWHVVFSPNLQRWACILKRDNMSQVFVDGKPGLVFSGAFNLTFSSDNSRFAYCAQTGTSWWMVVDDRIEAEIDLNASRPCFSPDGKRIAYIAGRGPLWRMMVDGKPGPEFSGKKGKSGGLLASETELPALTPPRFSPDSAHLVYAALSAQKWIVLFDGERVGEEYDDFVKGGPAFRENGEAEFLAFRDGVLYRLTLKPSRPTL